MAPLALPPTQGYTVDVFAINGARSHMPTSLFVAPPIYGHDELRLANYGFLISSPHRKQKVLFDLAFMKDLDQRMPPALKRIFEGGPGGVDAVYDIPDALTDGKIALSSINAVIWSHAHIDHVGDPAVFPSSTDLVVGPGFKLANVPGYPVNPDAFLLDSAFEGRNVREMDFADGELEIGGFPALDYFDDGSFYLFFTPGHTAHHVGGLARTTDDTFVFMAGDACHHVGQLRPSAGSAMPETVPSTVPPPMGGCSCSCFKPLLPQGEETASFYGLAPGMHEDPIKAEDTVRKLKIFDGNDGVFVIIAHDWSLLDVIDFFPNRLNDWKQQNWGEEGRWRFLGDFEKAVGK